VKNLSDVGLAKLHNDASSQRHSPQPFNAFDQTMDKQFRGARSVSCDICLDCIQIVATLFGPNHFGHRLFFAEKLSFDFFVGNDFAGISLFYADLDLRQEVQLVDRSLD
jgi:hypothetical protein